MSANTTPPETVPVLATSADLSILAEVQALQCGEAADLRVAEQRLRETVEALVSAPGDLELADRAQQEAWAVIEQWCALRASLDAGVPPDQMGRWSLTTTEGLWVDCGLVHTGLVREPFEPQQLGVQLASIFRVPPGETLDLWSFSRWLIDSYRKQLRVEEYLKHRDRCSVVQGNLAQARTDLEQSLEHAREFLIECELGDEALQAYERIEELMPHLARVTLLSRSGQVRDRGNRRVQIKVSQSVALLQQELETALGSYNLRKRYQDLHSEVLTRTMAFIEVEEQAERSEHSGEEAGPFDVSQAACRKAVEGALEEMRRLVGAVSRTPDFYPAPFLMEHLPRLGARTLAELQEQVFVACPRLRLARQEEWYPLPRVALLPGTGNAIYDSESGAVLCTLFPTEARLNSVIGALGEAFLARESEMARSYENLRKQERGKALGDAFRKDFLAWVAGDHRIRRHLPKEVHKWFHYQLVVRRQSPTARSTA